MESEAGAVPSFQTAVMNSSNILLRNIRSFANPISCKNSTTWCSHNLNFMKDVYGHISVSAIYNKK